MTEDITDVELWLGINNKIGIDIWRRKYQQGYESFPDWLDRVSGGDKKLRQLILDKKFLFGGRVLANRGIPGTGNYFNCYSDGYVEDNLEGILETNKTLGLTYKIQGGQGISLSKIRPKGTQVGEHYSSDGIEPFMRIFNETTAGVSQGGSRKGALMMSLDIKHKEAERFITIKTDLDEITKANLSLEIDNQFMGCIQRYYEGKPGDMIRMKGNYDGHEIDYDVDPIALYKLMMKTVYDYGEPGCIFTDQFRNYNLMEHVKEYDIVTSNPCGEQPLKAKTACNLGSLNLYEFVKNPCTTDAVFLYSEFYEAIDIAVEALDDLIDENVERIPENLSNGEYKQNAKDWRNLGLGVMGYADMLIALGMEYGSFETLVFTENLFDTMFKHAVEASSKLAIKKGSFPKYSEDIWSSTIIEKHFKSNLNGQISKEDAIDIVTLSKQGLRNCSLLSIAPTGTISTMLNRSGGIEPNFAFEYTRKTDNLDESYTIEADIAKQYRTANPGIEQLPDIFVAAKDVNWRNRVRTQGTIQSHIDTAISSTVNLKNEATLEEVELLYLQAWKEGCKGITIYRDGCKREGILVDNLSKDDSSDSEGSKSITNPTKEDLLSRGIVIDVDEDVVGRYRRLVTGCGTLHCIAMFDPVSGDLMQTYLSKGSTGGCNCFMIALSRMSSLAARGGVHIDDIIDQLNSSGACVSYAVRAATKHDTSKGSSCPVAVGFKLREMYDEIQETLGTDEWEEVETIRAGDMIEEFPPMEEIESMSPKCPSCGEDLIIEGGCDSCKYCGYSSCG